MKVQNCLGEQYEEGIKENLNIIRFAIQEINKEIIKSKRKMTKEQKIIKEDIYNEIIDNSIFSSPYTKDEVICFLKIMEKETKKEMSGNEIRFLFEILETYKIKNDFLKADISARIIRLNILKEEK